MCRRVCRGGRRAATFGCRTQRVPRMSNSFLTFLHHCLQVTGLEVVATLADDAEEPARRSGKATASSVELAKRHDAEAAAHRQLSPREAKNPSKYSLNRLPSPSTACQAPTDRVRRPVIPEASATRASELLLLARFVMTMFRPQ